MPEPEEEVLISVAPGADLAAVAARLRSASVHVEGVLEYIGVITARLPLSRISEVSGLEGVAGVEPSRQVRIAPPESDVQ